MNKLKIEVVDIDDIQIDKIDTRVIVWIDECNEEPELLDLDLLNEIVHDLNSLL